MRDPAGQGTQISYSFQDRPRSILSCLACLRYSGEVRRVLIFQTLHWSSLTENLPSRFVSVKICQGSDNDQPDTEASILQHVKDNPSSGSENVLDLYDMFVIRGPNGYHVCLVTQVVVSLAALGAGGGRLQLLYDPRSVISQLARGFAYLHSQGIFHGGKTSAIAPGKQGVYFNNMANGISSQTPRRTT